MLVIIGLSQGNATALGVAIHEIGDGIAKIIVGVTALIPLLTAAGRALEVQPKHVARRGSAASVRVAYPARSVPHSQRCKMPLQHLHKPHQMLAIIMCKAWMFFMPRKNSTKRECTNWQMSFAS
jgi:hypothetical protein